MRLNEELSKEVELFKAVKNGDIARVKELLKKNADVNARYKDGNTLLHLVLEGYMEEEHIVDIVKILLENGADPNAKNVYGTTPLHQALLYDHFDAAKILIEKGAKVNIENNYGYTPLHYAASQGTLWIISLLLEKGADPNARSIGGVTPLHDAARSGNREAIELLFNYGADPNPRDKSGWTPLHYAACSRNSIVAHLLTGHGADVNAKENTHSWTPLHVAMLPVDPPRGNESINFYTYISNYRDDLAATSFAMVLISHGADLNARDKDGNTPLHLAIAIGYFYVSWLLLNFGADPTIRNNEGKLPIEYARDSVRYYHSVYYSEKMLEKILNLLACASKEFLEDSKDSHVNNRADVSRAREPDAVTAVCPYCGKPAYRLGTLGRYYCFNCKRYV
jgi:cytohesin